MCRATIKIVNKSRIGHVTFIGTQNNGGHDADCFARTGVLTRNHSQALSRRRTVRHDRSPQVGLGVGGDVHKTESSYRWAVQRETPEAVPRAKNGLSLNTGTVQL